VSVSRAVAEPAATLRRKKTWNIPSDAGPPSEAARHEPIAWLEKLNKALGTLVEVPAALLVLAEVVVLLMGVTSRYVFTSRSYGPTNWHRSCSSGWRCWGRSSRSSVANTCA
jgi:hypothetical protein